jgi:glutathione peroxidase
MIMVLFTGYVCFITRNTENMTIRQKILKAVYPIVMWFSKRGSQSKMASNTAAVPPLSFYSLKINAVDGSPFDLSRLKGKKILLVNTASDCGFTDQYKELEQLYRLHKEKLEILAFPANDFKEQEKGSNAEIAAFCKKNYGVSFPIMSKSVVIVSPEQNPVFKWLTNPAANGWNSQPPSWNFSKYLVNEKGQLTHFFATGVSPLSKEVADAIEKQ